MYIIFVFFLGVSRRKVDVQSLESAFTDLRTTVIEKTSGTINTYF